MNVNNEANPKHSTEPVYLYAGEVMLTTSRTLWRTSVEDSSLSTVVQKLKDQRMTDPEVTATRLVVKKVEVVAVIEIPKGNL